MRKCEVCGLEGNPPEIIYHKRKMFLCVKHRAQIRVYGFFFKRTVHDKNDYVVKGEVTEIKLYNSSNEHIASTLIDTEDLERVTSIKWYLSKKGYAESVIGDNRHIKLHIFLIGKVDNKVIDHINRNRLDNRKSNLRHATYLENVLNSAYRENKPQRRKIKNVFAEN